MPVVYLAAAILIEVAATTSLKYSDGFSRLWPSIGVVVGYSASFALLAQALKEIEVGVAYAVWSGVGTALITIIGLAVFGESATALKLSGIALIILGVVALHLG